MEREYVGSLNVLLLFFSLYIRTDFQVYKSSFFLSLSILKSSITSVYICKFLSLCIEVIRCYEILWINFMQPQAMLVLALHFRFTLVFDNSRIGVQLRNKLIFCKMNIALLPLRSCLAPAHN